MSMATASAAYTSAVLPDGTNIRAESFFGIDDEPARSPNCVGWGPHNILQVCSRWSVSFYLATLLSPAAQLQIRHHPLCHREDMESVEVAVGAKWSPSLLPEVVYPATARFGVQTTSNLVVYRVSRRGASVVEVSSGIGIACCRRDGESGSAGEADALGTTSAGVPKPSASNSKGTATAKKHKAEQGAGGKAKPKRRRRRSSDTESDAEDSSDKEIVDSAPPSSSASAVNDSADDDADSNANRCTTGEKKPSPKANAKTTAVRGSKRAAGCAKQREVLDLGEVDSDASSLSPSKRPCKEASPQLTVDDHAAQHSNSNAGDGGSATLMDFVWLSHDDLCILSSKGLHVVSFYGDLSDDDGPQTRLLPPPLYRWGGPEDEIVRGYRAPTPVCLAALSTTGLPSETSPVPLAFLHRTVVVASPYLVRVLYVLPSPSLSTKTSSSSSSNSDVARVHLLQFLEIPMLTAVPSALCAVATAVSSLSDAASLAAGDTVEVAAFVSAPLTVLRGRFTLSIAASVSPKTLPSSRRGEWAMDNQFGVDQHVGEVSLLGFCVVPFSARTPSSVGRPSEHLLHSLSAAVLGVGERALYQYLTSGPSHATLLQCPLLVGKSAMPAHRCAGLCGVALHPSGTMAIAALQSGHLKAEPLHLCPCTAEDPSSWLRRLLELSGTARAIQESDGNEAALGKTLSPNGATRRGDGAAHHMIGPSDDTGANALGASLTQHLLQQQTGSSFFLREPLLAASVAQSTALFQYARRYRAARRMPSAEVLKRHRAITASLDSSPHVIADVGLRRRYLQLRAQYGVTLFLRWPLPATHGGATAASVLASSKAMCAASASWPWWRLLRHIWADCPWDTPVLRELVLSNAVHILAKRHRYANMSFAPAERFRERGLTDSAGSGEVEEGGTREGSSRCSTSPETVDVDGARAYVVAYVRHQEEVLQRMKKEGSDANAVGTPNPPHVLTASDCGVLLSTALSCATGNDDSPSAPSESCAPAAAQVHWCVSPSWVSALRDFLTAISGLPPSLELPDTDSSALFPCSLCDRANVASMDMSLSCVSTHVPSSDQCVATTKEATSAETRSNVVEKEAPSSLEASTAAAHTTLFSGTTLSPLSLFAAEYVLTRCLSCGLCDYADGPLCRVCGGLLE